MSLGILLLRLTLALILLAHSSQKTLGWCHGLGIEKQAKVFEDLGLRPGPFMVVIAGVAEALAALSIAFGFLTPLGAALAAGTMLVAGITLQSNAHKFWNAGGGGEYPYVLAFASFVLGFSGSGQFSLDHLIGAAMPGFERLDEGALVGLAVVGVAVLSSVPFVVIIRRSTGRPGN